MKSEEKMSDYAVHLGDGVWWQISLIDYFLNRFSNMPVRYRKWK